MPASCTSRSDGTYLEQLGFGAAAGHQMCKHLGLRSVETALKLPDYLHTSDVSVQLYSPGLLAYCARHRQVLESQGKFKFAGEHGGNHLSI